MSKVVIFTLLVTSCAWSQTVVQFSADPTDTPAGAFAVGPFPTDSLTAPAATPTGLQVNLPPSESSCNPRSGAVCSNTALLNQLDGFSVNPRLMVCFSSDVDTSTLPTGISIVSQPGNSSIAVKQVVFDDQSKCAFAKPDQVLNQTSKYLLLVTDAVHDSNGQPVTASPAFSACTGGSTEPYCAALTHSLAGIAPPSGTAIVAASRFTTMAATAWLEQARRFVDTRLPLVVPAGAPSTFTLSKVQTMTWVPDRAGIPPQNIPLGVLPNVSSISFGLFLSPNYLNGAGASEATITRGPTSPLAYTPVSFHVFLPDAKKKDKIPVVIYGHGLGDSQFGGPTYMASTLAQRGFATLALEFPGHGFGPGGFVNLTGKDHKTSTVLTPGRGVPGAGKTIGSTDGCVSFGPIGIRDCDRQAALDLAALVHAIQATGGLGLNLDTSRIYYVGQSFGSIVGTLFQAIEPAVSTAVLNGAGGASADIARLALTGRPLGSAFLLSVGDPLLFNVAAGFAPPEEYFHAPFDPNDPFNDGYVFRNSPSATNKVPGAMAIQAAFEAAEWMGMIGDPLAFAPHLKAAPLSGVPAKHTLFQFGFSDLEVPNPTELAVVRAAQAQNATSYFRFDKAAALEPGLLTLTDPAVPGLPIVPHRVMSNPTVFVPGNEAETSLAVAEQKQAADYFLTNGASVSDANKYVSSPFSEGDNLFENSVNNVPENLIFIQIPK